MKKSENLKRLESSGVVAILRGIEKGKVIPTVKALYDGGITCVEITFNTTGAKEMIAQIKETFDDALMVGAGTVIDDITAKIAIDAGATFVLSPSLHREVIELCNRYGVISVPGVYTPTEIVQAYKWGADIVKIFPADAVGPKYIKSIRGPLDHIPIMAVGGVDLENAEDFIRAGAMSVGVGSALTPKRYLELEQYEKITELASKFTDRIRAAKKKL